VRNAECGVRNAEWGVRSAEWGEGRIAECEIKSVDLKFFIYYSALRIHHSALEGELS